MKFEQFSELLRMGQDQKFNLGTAENAPSKEWIESAEVAIGHTFPPSYQEFLARHGGGDIYGVEISLRISAASRTARERWSRQRSGVTANTVNGRLRDFSGRARVTETGSVTDRHHRGGSRTGSLVE